MPSTKPDSYHPGSGLPWPEHSARDYLAQQLAGTVDTGDLEAALRVLNAVANTTVEPLDRKIATDGSGNPLTDTPERLHAWATWSAARREVESAHGWADFLTHAIQMQAEGE